METGNPAWRCRSSFWYSKVFKISKIYYGCFKAVKLVKNVIYKTFSGICQVFVHNNCMKWLKIIGLTIGLLLVNKDFKLIPIHKMWSPASKASREIANLTKKNLHTIVYGVKEFVCLSVIYENVWIETNALQHLTFNLSPNFRAILNCFRNFRSYGELVKILSCCLLWRWTHFSFVHLDSCVEHNMQNDAKNPDNSSATTIFFQNITFRVLKFTSMFA